MWYSTSLIKVQFLVNNIISVVSDMSSRLTTLQKAKKILNYCEDIQPRKYSVIPQKEQIEKSPSRMQFSSTSKSQSRLKKDFSFRDIKSKSKINNTLSNTISRNSSALKLKNIKNSSFISTYGKETRYDKIMKLKIKPTFQGTKKNDKHKKSIINNSYSSRDSREQSKEQKGRNKITTRLQKIMQIKVEKPKVNSTLIYYEPRHSSKSSTKQRKESVVKQWKQCKAKMQKSNEQEQKQDRLWKVFQRERQLRYKLKREAQQREFKQQRRKEQRFQSMVSKQVFKIEKQREIVKRKSEGFSNFIYPLY